MWGIEGNYRKNLDFLRVYKRNNFSFKSYDGSKIFRGIEGDFGRCGGGGGWVPTV